VQGQGARRVVVHARGVGVGPRSVFDDPFFDEGPSGWSRPYRSVDPFAQMEREFAELDRMLDQRVGVAVRRGQGEGESASSRGRGTGGTARVVQQEPGVYREEQSWEDRGPGRYSSFRSSVTIVGGGPGIAPRARPPEATTSFLGSGMGVLPFVLLCTAAFLYIRTAIRFWDRIPSRTAFSDRLSNAWIAALWLPLYAVSPHYRASFRRAFREDYITRESKALPEDLQQQDTERNRAPAPTGED